MRLVIDRGNTLTKVALFHQQSLVDIISVEIFNEDIFRDFLNKTALRIGSPVTLRSVILGSVVNNNKDILDILPPDIKRIEMSPQVLLPIQIQYKSRETLGNDRIALAVGGHSYLPGKDVLVIGLGTCITYDLTDQNAVYRGGGISPGIAMRLKALHTFTSKLPLVKQVLKAPLVGDSTESSIQSGVVNGVVAEIEGIIQRYERQFPGIQVIITGGDMNYFDKISKSNIFAASNLVLFGLLEILSYNE